MVLEGVFLGLRLPELEILTWQLCLFLLMFTETTGPIGWRVGILPPDLLLCVGVGAATGALT